MDFAKTRQILDLKLLCFLVLISISFIYQQQAFATVYTLTTPYPNISPAISHNVNLTATMTEINVNDCGTSNPASITFIDPTTHVTTSYTNPIGVVFPCTISFARFDTSSLPSTINVTSVKLFFQNHVGNNMDVSCAVGSVPDDPNTASASTLYADHNNFNTNAGFNAFTDCESSNTNQIPLEELNQTGFIGDFISKRLQHSWYAFSIQPSNHNLSNFNRTANLGPIKLNVKYFDYNSTPANSARALFLNPTNSCSSPFYSSNFNKTTSASDNTSTHPFPECSAMIWRYDVTGIPANAQISQVNITEGIQAVQQFTATKNCNLAGITDDPNLGTTSGSTLKNDIANNFLVTEASCSTTGNANFNAGTAFKNFFINHFKNGWFSYSTSPRAEAGIGGQNYVIFNATGLKITAHVPTLTLVPTSGNVGISVTASGTGFTPNSLNTITDGGTNSGQSNNYGAVSVEKFNIGANQGMQSLQLFAQDTGAGNHTRTYNGANTRNDMTNTLYLTRITGFTPNATINKITLICACSIGQFVDVGVYDDSGPPTSLGEAGAGKILSSTGPTTWSVGGNPVSQNFTENAKVPTSGNLWIGVMSNQTWDLYSNLGSTRNCKIGISFPNFPVNPTCNDGTGITYYLQVWYNNHNSGIIIKGYDNSGSGGNPNVELFESPKQLIQNGFHNYTINSATTASGIVYLGYEVNNTDALFGFSTNLSPASSCGITHTFGTGPNPFGTTSCGIGASTTYEKVYYDTTFNKITLKFDGNTLTTVPSSIFTTDNGTFSGIFSVPSSTGGSHTVNASDTSNWASAIFSTNAQYSVSLRPTLHDGVTPITSGKLIVTQNGVTIGTGNTNSSGYAKVSNLNSGNYNFTILDDKNFAVYKELNTNVNSNIAKNVATNDYPFDCVSPFSGYQSDFVIRINDTDGTHITNISTPTCQNQNQLKFNMTFTGNGQSGNTFSSSMITTAGTQVYAANPSSFTVSGTSVPTTFTGGNNIVSNSFSIGSGLVTTTKIFIMNLTATQSTNAGAGSSGQNYFTTNSTCFAGVFDPKSNSCVFGLVNITAPPVIITTNPNTQQNGGVEVDCSGNGYITITSANLGSNPLGIALGQLPVNIQCGQTTPTTCPTGTTLTNGVCVSPLTCPVGSQTQNGVCTAPLTCPAGTTLQNAQCIAPTTCADGSQPVNGQCNNIVPIILPPTPSPCDITNPLSCITSTTQSQDVVVTGVTPDGKPISVTTTVTKVLNPELNNVSLVIILLIIAAIIAGIIYRYLTRKKKPKGRKVKNYSGKGNKIDKFNKKVKNEV